MFGPEPAFVALTLDAALRDVHAKRPQARANAMHALAGATLRELDGERPPGRDGAQSPPDQDTVRPHFDALTRHDRGAQVRQALQVGLDDEDPQLRGLALLGLGRLGDPGLLEEAESVLELRGDDPGMVFLRECAVIGLSHLGESADGESHDVHGRVLARLRTLASDDQPDLRFQAVVALARVGGTGETARLRTALGQEPHAEVREHILVALGMLDASDEQTCQVVIATLEAARAETRDREHNAGLGRPAPSPEAFEAARLLASAGRGDGKAELVAALPHRELRDDALEALAVLPASDLDEELLTTIRRMAQGWFTPPITRVRAAYCLARSLPQEGLALLARFERSPRAAVREAVRDAHAALARLDARADAVD